MSKDRETIDAEYVDSLLKIIDRQRWTINTLGRTIRKLQDQIKGMLND